MLYPLPQNLKVLFFYNTAAATLWFCCLGRLLILLPLVGRRFLPGGIAEFFQVVASTPAGAYLVTMLMVQTGSLWNLANGIRMVWLCFGIIFPHPKIAKHTTYSVLIFSWCIANFVHFACQAFRIKTKSSPFFLFWLEYNNFFITFPLAYAAEIAQVFLSLSFVADDSLHEWAVKLSLLAYVPVGYFTWMHYIERRRTKYVAVMEKRRLGRVATPATTESATSTNVEMQDLNEQ